jgi:hypothetical protein
MRPKSTVCPIAELDIRGPAQHPVERPERDARALLRDRLADGGDRRRGAGKALHQTPFWPGRPGPMATPLSAGGRITAWPSSHGRFSASSCPIDPSGRMPGPSGRAFRRTCRIAAPTRAEAAISPSARAAANGRGSRSALPADEPHQERDQADRALRVEDRVAGRQHEGRAAGDDLDEGAAQKPLRRDRGGGIVGQFEVSGDAERGLGAETLGVRAPSPSRCPRAHRQAAPRCPRRSPRRTGRRRSAHRPPHRRTCRRPTTRHRRKSRRRPDDRRAHEDLGDGVVALRHGGPPLPRLALTRGSTPRNRAAPRAPPGGWSPPAHRPAPCRSGSADAAFPRSCAPWAPRSAARPRCGAASRASRG